MQKDTLDKVITLISRATDEELNAIFQAAHGRSRSLRGIKTREAMMQLSVGDEVELDNLKPKYMNGARGTIIDRKQTKFTVLLHDGLKFRGRSSTVVVPASCLTKILPIHDVPFTNHTSKENQ